MELMIFPRISINGKEIYWLILRFPIIGLIWELNDIYIWLDNVVIGVLAHQPSNWVFMEKQHAWILNVLAYPSLSKKATMLHLMGTMLWPMV